MKQQDPNRATSAVTQAARGYSPDEQAAINQLALGIAHKAEIAALFPGRTVAAVKQQIVAARHRLGLIEPRAQERRSDAYGCTMLDPDDPGIEDSDFPAYCADQRQGSTALLAAMRAA